MTYSESLEISGTKKNKNNLEFKLCTYEYVNKLEL